MTPPSSRAQDHLALPQGRLIFSAKTKGLAESDGAWNIYASEPSGGAWRRLSANAAPALDPAVSPDGKLIAFRSRREGFWEIYTMPLTSPPTPPLIGEGRRGEVTRLTRGMVYSGAPAWSPDGKKIAFESFVRGDLDIFVMNADGSQPVNLTDESKNHDYGPAWSPDGKWIAFTSWRTGTQQIFYVAADTNPVGTVRRAINLSQNKFNDQQPAWSPDGKKIAFVSDRDPTGTSGGQRAIYTADVDGRVGNTPLLKNIRRLTFSGWDDQPAWSPDGQWIAFVSARPTRQPVYIIPADGGIPRVLDNNLAYASSVTWAPAPVSTSDDATDKFAIVDSPSPSEPTPTTGDHPYEMRRITSVRLDPGINKLNNRVADSFIAFQARLKEQVGYDFLATMSDITRPIDSKCDVTCDTLSWHKAGRAWDSRLDYSDARGNPAMEIVREDQQGETFWRVFLRAAAQDGSMGEPMKEAPWDISYRARWIVGRGEGGTKKALPLGFYVDFTELAREYGWERISSHDGEDFDWKTNKLAAEYWHYQKTQGLNWYQAMTEVYSEADVKPLADWNALTKSGYDQYVLFLKGIPAPAKAWRWFALGP